MERVQVSVPTGSTLNLHFANQKALQLHQHVPLAQQATKSHWSLQLLEAGKSIAAVPSFIANHRHPKRISRVARRTFFFCGRHHEGQEPGSCGWQGVERAAALSVSPTQVRLKRVDSIFAVTSEKFSDGGAEGPLPGLRCTERSDKATGKGVDLGSAAEEGGRLEPYCYPRKSSLIPQITFRARDPIQSHCVTSGESDSL